jgi:hypothetical protein
VQLLVEVLYGKCVDKLAVVKIYSAVRLLGSLGRNSRLFNVTALDIIKRAVNSAATAWR